MTDNEVHVEVQLLSNAPSGQHDFMELKDSDCMKTIQNTGQEPLSSLPNVTLAPPCGDELACSSDCEACSSVEVRRVETSLEFMQLQLQLIMNKADYLEACLLGNQGHTDTERLAAAVPNFLFSCQPYFNELEAAVGGMVFQLTPVPYDAYTRRMQLLDFFQQLCDRLEQLVLTYASHNLLSLDEADPHSVSHFFIGQSHLGGLSLSTFLYCRPTPYLAHVDTGLYKRMRWNVDRLGDEPQTDGEQSGRNVDTEYYFLCYEEFPDAEADEDHQGVPDSNTVRMWSIGQWVQVYPDPDTEDIYDWITCSVPQASYRKLLFLGRDEPSSYSATDFLLQLLLLS